MKTNLHDTQFVRIIFSTSTFKTQTQNHPHHLATAPGAPPNWCCHSNTTRANMLPLPMQICALSGADKTIALNDVAETMHTAWM